MAHPGFKGLLLASLVNAVTFEVLVNMSAAFVVRQTGPWATSVGIVGTLLFLASCVIYAFPDTVCNLSKARLFEALSQLLRFLLPWMGLKLLWAPGSYCLCRLTMRLFAKRCHRLRFLNAAQLVFGGICLYTALHRTRLTERFECWLHCWWTNTIIYRFISGCRFQPSGGGGGGGGCGDNVTEVEIVMDDRPTPPTANRRTSKRKTCDKSDSKRTSSQTRPKRGASRRRNNCR